MDLNALRTAPQTPPPDCGGCGLSKLTFGLSYRKHIIIIMYAHMYYNNYEHYNNYAVHMY